MTRESYWEFLKKKQEEGFALMEMKNADYADENPFKNFDNVETTCNISSEKGILVRMSDKMTRIGNLLDKESSVVEESIEDTLLDLANYSYILLARINERKNEG